MLKVQPTVTDAMRGVDRLEKALGLPRTQAQQASKAAGKGLVTEEDLKNFEEVKARVREVTKQKNKAQETRAQAARDKRSLELQLDQVKRLPESSKTFKAVGRMFIASPTTELNSNLTEKLAKAEQRLTALTNTLQYLEKQEKEADDQFMETVSLLNKKTGALNSAPAAVTAALAATAGGAAAGGAAAGKKA